MSRITLQDKDLYGSTILGKPYAFTEDIEKWDMEMALLVYTTNQYKKYSGYYLDMVHDTVRVSYRLERTGKRGYIPQHFIYYEKGDVKKRVNWGSRLEEVQNIQGVTVSDEYLVAFIQYYLRDLTLRCLDGMFYRKKMNKYEDYLASRVTELMLFLKVDLYNKLFKDTTWAEDALRDTLNQTLDSVDAVNYTDKQKRQTKMFIVQKLGIRAKGK